MEVPAGTVLALAVDYDHFLILFRQKAGSRGLSNGEEHAQQHASGGGEAPNFHREG